MAASKSNYRQNTNQKSSRSSSGGKKSSTTKANSTKRSSTNSRGRSSQTNVQSRDSYTKEEWKEQKAFQDEMILVGTLVVSILLILSNFSMSGIVGKVINKFTFGLFGFIAYVIPVILFIGVAFYMSNRGNRLARKKMICGSLIVLIVMALSQMFTTEYELPITEYYKNAAKRHSGGGLIGGLITKLLHPLFGTAGTYVLLIAVFLLCLMIFTGKTLVTSLSRRGEQSIRDMRERHRETQVLKAQYEEEEEEQEKLYASRKQAIPAANIERRSAKIFTLAKKKEYDIDPETGEILNDELNPADAVLCGEGQVENAEKPAKHKKVSKLRKMTDVDMSEIIPDLDNLPITGSYAPSEEAVPTYEEELNKKFGNTGESFNGQSEKIEQDIGQQITSILDETKDRITSDVPSEPMDIENTPTIQEHDFLTERDDTMESDFNQMQSDSYENSYDPYEDNMVSQDVYKAEVPSESDLSASESIEPAKTHQDQTEKTKDGETIDLSADMEAALEEKPYVFPPLELLTEPKKNAKGVTKQDVKETATKLQKCLESFGVHVTITNVSCGPAVTRYEIQPEQGVKVSKITSLTDDIKLNLAAADIRIEAPIPGKAAVGIEVPNKENSAVMFRELIEDKKFTGHPSDLAFAVGKDIGGQVVVTDIAKMPHLLIAGATGSGKSVCINTLIMSILYKSDPNDVKLIMIDPKVVELSAYNGIPHLMIPVVTDPKLASSALNWAVAEMTERYKKLKELSVRDMKSYNEKIKEVEHLGDERYKKMPQIVIIVDELADLMMVAPGEVEDAICRLAQMARAAGIHLVLATQRPSVNVITGLIKANVPSRIAFSVSSAIDSRTIIDSAGAEKLLGKGDMLFFPQGIPKPIRVQGAFISDKEVSDVVEFLSRENGQAAYNHDVVDKISNTTVTNDIQKATASSNDEYFAEAGKFIIEKEKASIGMLQRVYKIGFNRAARIMDQLCEAGVVGPEEGTKPRKVLMSMEEFEQYLEEYA